MFMSDSYPHLNAQDSRVFTSMLSSKSSRLHTRHFSVTSDQPIGEQVVLLFNNTNHIKKDFNLIFYLCDNDKWNRLKEQMWNKC